MLIDKVKEAYAEYSSNENHFEVLPNGVLSIRTPYKDNMYHPIELYVKPLSDNRIKLTDGGWTFANLESRGIYIKNHKKLLKDILFAYKLNVSKDKFQEIYAEITIERLNSYQHRMIQGLLKIYDVSIYLDSAEKETLDKKIAEKLDYSNILYFNPMVTLRKDDVPLQFEFSIPTRQHHMKLIRTIAQPNNKAFIDVISKDIASTEENNVVYFVVMEDEGLEEQEKVNLRETLFSHSSLIEPIYFSELDHKIQLLSNE